MTTIVRNRSWEMNFQSFSSEENRRINRGDNLTGWTAEAQIVDRCGKLVAPLTVEIHSPVVGRLRVRLDRQQTQALPVGTFFWGAVYTDSSGRDYALQPMEPIEIRDEPPVPT